MNILLIKSEYLKSHIEIRNETRFRRRLFRLINGDGIGYNKVKGGVRQFGAKYITGGNPVW